LNIYAAPLIALVWAVLLTPVAIPLLIKMKFGQRIREIGPSWHKTKNGTPTMGGVIIITGVIAALVPFAGEMSHSARFALFCAVGFGIIGFADDFIKVCLKRNLGLRAWEKLSLQILAAVIFVFGGLRTGALSTAVAVPFTGMTVELSWLYIPLAVLWILYTVNSVNLTDGIDGLAASVTIAVIVFLGVADASPASPLSVFCYTVAGALAGFLVYNKYPAKVFMGDTGSLFLGGAVAAAALLQGNPLIVIAVGVIYAAETLSVVAQVTSFKLTGKRLFKMSPIHHHFEMSGWSEKKITAVFTAITVVMGILAFFAERLTR
jgi:phospho-N-acetylmuramoyl-pentapeptide-transferase